VHALLAGDAEMESEDTEAAMVSWWRRAGVLRAHLVPQLSRDADLVQGQTDDPKKTPSQYEILVTRLK